METMYKNYYANNIYRKPHTCHSDFNEDKPVHVELSILIINMFASKRRVLHVFISRTSLCNSWKASEGTRLYSKLIS